MMLPSPLELKKLLVLKGFEVYRTVGMKVLLAERVRNNLLMDGYVAACTGDFLELRFTARAQRNSFPNEIESQLFERARFCGEKALECGYREVGNLAVPIYDPGDTTKILDTWYEVTFARSVDSLDELTCEARFALSLDKVA